MANLNPKKQELHQNAWGEVVKHLPCVHATYVSQTCKAAKAGAEVRIKMQGEKLVKVYNFLKKLVENRKEYKLSGYFDSVEGGYKQFNKIDTQSWDTKQLIFGSGHLGSKLQKEAFFKGEDEASETVEQKLSRYLAYCSEIIVDRLDDEWSEIAKNVSVIWKNNNEKYPNNRDEASMVTWSNSVDAYRIFYNVIYLVFYKHLEFDLRMRGDNNYELTRQHYFDPFMDFLSEYTTQFGNKQSGGRKNKTVKSKSAPKKTKTTKKPASKKKVTK